MSNNTNSIIFFINLLFHFKVCLEYHDTAIIVLTILCNVWNHVWRVVLHLLYLAAHHTN